MHDITNTHADQIDGDGKLRAFIREERGADALHDRVASGKGASVVRRIFRVFGKEIRERVHVGLGVGGFVGAVVGEHGGFFGRSVGRLGKAEAGEGKDDCGSEGECFGRNS